MENGVLEHVFSGDEPGRHTGELLGHSGVITALFFYKYTVYTGSMDCTVQVLLGGELHGQRYAVEAFGGGLPRSQAGTVAQ